MADLPNLEAKQDLDEFVYHVKGLLEAVDVIRFQVETLDKTIDLDLELATNAMGRLRAEIYTHLTYHLKELRRPFLRLSHGLSEKLEGIGEGEATE